MNMTAVAPLPAPACPLPDGPGLPQPATLASLRTVVAGLEASRVRPNGAAFVPTGAPGLDQALGGGLALGGVTALEPAHPLDEAASDALALMLAAIAASQRGGDVVIVQDPAARAMRGAVYGPGLVQAGIAAHRLLLVAPRRPGDVRACVEEAARTAGLAAVIGLLGPQAGFGLVPARRVQLAVEEAWGLVVLGGGLRTTPFAPARARLRVSPCPGALPDWAVSGQAIGPGLPPPGARAWQIEIVRTRTGGRGRITVETAHDPACDRRPAAARAPLRLREPALVADRAPGAPQRLAPLQAA